MDRAVNENQNEAAPAVKRNWITHWLSHQFKLTPIEAHVCASGAMVFICGALLFITLNWDNKIYALFLSIAFCGTVTTFMTVGGLLKEENIQETFFVSIPFDMKTGDFPLIVPHVAPDTENMSMVLHLMELSGLAGRVGLEWSPQNPKSTRNDEAVFRYCGELLQYQIFRILYRLQNNLWLSVQLSAKENKETDNPLAAFKTSEYRGGHLLKFLEGNRFAQPELEQIFWQQGQMHLPEHSRVTLGEIAPPMGVGYSGHKVRLIKGGFFELGLSVIPVGATDLGILPFGLNLPDDEKGTVRTFQYTIQMSAHFNKLTAGNLQTGALKRWIRRLFRNLKESLSDGALPEASEGS